MKTVVSSSSVNQTTTASNTANVAIVAPNVALKVEPAEDNNLQFSTPNATAKRPASLDLNKVALAKKQRLVAPLIVDSPDMQNMKELNTPDIEKMLLAGNLLQTPQPGLVFPTKVGEVTTEQEEFGKGFEEALHSLRNSKNAQAHSTATVPTTISATTSTTAPPVGSNMSGGSFTYTNLESTYPVAIKDEPHTSSPPVSPIDMETQEKIKLERKRQRNRVAASKCRKRKLERISRLEDKVKILKGENTDLGSVVKSLKDHVAQLKQKVIEHIGAGCSIPAIYNGNALMQAK